MVSIEVQGFLVDGEEVLIELYHLLLLDEHILYFAGFLDLRVSDSFGCTPTKEKSNKFII